MKAYSMDLRNRALDDCDAGMELRQVAVKYRVSESWIRLLRQRRRESGETALRQCRTAGPQWQAYADSLRQVLADRPDATLSEMKEELKIPLSIPSLPGVDRPPVHCEKKVLRAAEQDRTDVADGRTNWREWQGTLNLEDIGRFVFIDETWASTNMSRRYGRSLKGQRLISADLHARQLARPGQNGTEHPHETMPRPPDIETLTSKAAAWESQRHQSHSKIDWHFTTTDARVKLKRLYPSFQI